jgi:hypothetical protein
MSLFGNWFADQIGHGFMMMILFVAVVITLAKKFANANSEVKDAARKAAASKAIQLISRFFK